MDWLLKRARLEIDPSEPEAAKIQYDTVTFTMGSSRDAFIVDNPSKSCGVAVSFFPIPSLFSNLQNDCCPIATKSRHFNNDDKNFIRNEIGNLLKEDIIETYHSPLRAEVLVTKTRNDDQVNQITKGKVYSTLDLNSAYYQIALCKEDSQYTAFEADDMLYQYCRLPFGVSNGVSIFQRTIDSLIEKHK